MESEICYWSMMQGSNCKNSTMHYFIIWIVAFHNWNELKTIKMKKTLLLHEISWTTKQKEEWNEIDNMKTLKQGWNRVRDGSRGRGREGERDFRTWAADRSRWQLAERLFDCVTTWLHLFLFITRQFVIRHLSNRHSTFNIRQSIWLQGHSTYSILIFSSCIVCIPIIRLPWFFSFSYQSHQYLQSFSWVL